MLFFIFACAAFFVLGFESAKISIAHYYVVDHGKSFAVILGNGSLVVAEGLENIPVCQAQHVEMSTGNIRVYKLGENPSLTFSPCQFQLIRDTKQVPQKIFGLPREWISLR